MDHLNKEGFEEGDEGLMSSDLDKQFDESIVQTPKSRPMADERHALQSAQRDYTDMVKLESDLPSDSGAAPFSRNMSESMVQVTDSVVAKWTPNI